MLGLGLGITGVRGLWSPARLFSGGAQGLFLDPSDLTTMFQDRAGTTLVTTPGQSVGLVLDKRLGLTPGPELVTNGDFSNGTTGWTLSGSGGSWSVISGEAALVNSTTAFSPRITQSLSLIVGNTYKVSAFGRRGTAPDAFISMATTATGAAVAASATFGTAMSERTFIFTATAATMFVRLDAGGTSTTAFFDNISVREIPGNHMVATADASRGTYGIEPFGGRRNLLERTEEFDNAAWAKIDAIVTANATVAPDGTATADAAVFDGTTDARLEQAASVASPVTFSVWMRVASGTASVLIGTRSANVVAVTVTDTWQRFSMTATDSAFPRIRCTSATTVFLWGAQLEVGSTATAYQRVGSAFDVTEAGVPTVHYVQFDGADDGYLTSTITPGTDKAQVFAGVRKLSDANRANIVESGANQPSSIRLEGPPFAGGQAYGFGSSGTVPTFNYAASSGFAAPVTSVITGLGDIAGDLATLRVNGTQVAQSTADQGTGNFLAYPLYIGRRGGTTLPFNGRLYQMVVRFGSNLDAYQIAAAEAWVNSKTGAY